MPMPMPIQPKMYKKKGLLVNDAYVTAYGSQIQLSLAKNLSLPKASSSLSIPTFKDYGLLLTTKYTMDQLKLIAKTHKLKHGGNKNELLTRIYFYLYLSNSATQIQKIMRSYLLKKYIRLRGPGFKNRLSCTNNFDFLTMDELTNIPDEQFFSFTDKDGFIYGFDVVSLYNLIYTNGRNNKDVKNPFNQQLITAEVIGHLGALLRISKILHIKVVLKIDDLASEITDAKSVELRALTLFQHIDALGNYSNSQWFLSLNKQRLLNMIHHLFDIWTYRAHLSPEMMTDICHPSGDPFRGLPSIKFLQSVQNIDTLRKLILEVMEQLTTTGVNKDSQCLGAYYVLGAITLVSHEASTSIPWLYESMCYM